MKNFHRYALASFIGAVMSLSMMSSAHAGKFDYNRYVKCLKTPLLHFDGTIAEAAEVTPELSTLYGLVVHAGLADALSGPGPLTVYAPVDDAFKKVPASLVELLKGDPEGLLTKVLTYHVSAGTRDPRISFYPKETNTLQGQTVFLDYENNKGPQVNQSNVLSCQGVRASNGVVWLIDSVLLPQFTEDLPNTDIVEQ